VYLYTDDLYAHLQIEVINQMMLLTAKPVIYLVNLSESDYERKKNKWLPKIKEWIDTNNPGDMLIPFSVSLEERLMSEGGIENTTPGLSKIISSGYKALGLQYYFTIGQPECRAWTIREGTKAPQAAVNMSLYIQFGALLTLLHFTGSNSQ
jgi:obg-like ATPase 1